jgi:hypothetical protein
MADVVRADLPFEGQLRLVCRHYGCTDLVACSVKGDAGLVRIYCPLRIANVILSQPASTTNPAPASGPAASINSGQTSGCLVRKFDRQLEYPKVPMARSESHQAVLGPLCEFVGRKISRPA